MQENGKWKEAVKKTLQYVIVFAIFAVALVVYLKLHPETWLKMIGNSVSVQELQESPQTDYTGYAAGDGIEPIQSIEEYNEVLPITGNYAVVTPTDIIDTNVYVRMPWAEADYSSNRKDKSVFSPQVSMSFLQESSYSYCEYYLIGLPDGEYILALMDRKLASRLKKGEEITLPLGRKDGKTQSATKLLQPVLTQYHVTDGYVLNTMNTALYEKNEFIVFAIRFGISVGVFLILAFASVFLFKKIFSEDDVFSL